MWIISKSSACLLGAIVFFPFQIGAQSVQNSIDLNGVNFPQEKIHIHFDKESYLPGETVWFKAYLFEENLPSERSTNFYTALYDENGKLVGQNVSPVFGSSSEGHFLIPDSLNSTQLICRAYTSWMMNFDSSLIFSRAIKINSFDAAAKNSLFQKTVSLQFFPEGGDLLEGTVNSIAFKANYNNGLPFLVDAVIKKEETGEVMMPLIIIHDGMGKFDLEINQADKFYAEWIDNNGLPRKTRLPDAKPAGLSLKLAVQKDKLYYNLVNKTGNDSLHILMYMYQNVFYKADIKVSASESYTGLVPIKALPAGTMQVTVFDANWQPVAERVSFVNNDYTLNAAIVVKDINTQKRGKNSIEIIVADTIPANMSLSITDAEMNDEVSENTIVSNFLLKSDLKGYIHNPAYYFTNGADMGLKNKLDLVMLTNGWRRYNWTDLMLHKNPDIRFPADEYLSVYGQIGQEAFAGLDKDEFINLIVKTVDSTNTFYSIKPDKTGFLKQTGLVFYDSARLYFTFNKSKLQNRQMAFSASNFTLSQPAVINNFKNYIFPDTAGTVYNPAKVLFNYYKNNGGVNLYNEEKTLQGVVLKTNNRRNWQNDPKLKLDERYSTGMFSGGALGYSLDVLHDEKAWTKYDFYSYIRNTIPGLHIGNYNLTAGRPLIYGDRSVLVYIDEHEMTTNDLENLSLSQVAYIKFIPNFMGRGADAGGSSFSPAISVYTRKGDDLIDRRPKETDLNMVKVAGYTPVKQFYSPEYSQTNTQTGVDARTTLLWVPYILTDRKNRKVPITFYNNDFTKKMRLVLEGINDQGKMIRIEKMIEQ